MASKSKARQKLLRQIGFKFQVAASHVEEKKSPGKRCGDLAKENALLKARDVARRFDSGVIIGADTVVLARGKIIGKPKSMKDAFKTLKLLSQGPQWVYTGLAVIDIDNNKVFKAYDKTKVYLYHLSDRQIKSYLKRAPVLDKAGSLDIQGVGSIFISRIEGCFYNVVGLPLDMLARILKKTGIDLFKRSS